MLDQLKEIEKTALDSLEAVHDAAALEAILGCGLEALRVIAHLLHPAMPGTARSIGASLGFAIGPIGALANDAAPSEGRRYAVTGFDGR